MKETIQRVTIPAVPNGAREPSATHGLPQEEQIRADAYRILGTLLGAPPTRALLEALAAPAAAPSPLETPPGDADAGEVGPGEVGPGEVGQGWQRLRCAAADAEVGALDDEYHDLFIGLGRGEVVPYASWYLTGFLMEQPLSAVRDDLRAVGIVANPREKDPEDHIAALCESMALIIGAADAGPAWQQRFFMRHLHPWAERFFRELENASAARFYRAVGFFGGHLMAWEHRYLNLEVH